MTSMTNSNSTRYYSDRQEKQVVKLLGGYQVANSGAGKWTKGDVVIPETLLVECKTQTSDKESFTIKKEWLDKNLKEAKETHLPNSCLAFNFGPDQKNYFIINESLMKFLVENLLNMDN